MTKKQSVSKVLELILDEVEAGRMPDDVLIRQGRSSLRSLSKSLKAATSAAKASGNSGRKETYDREAIKADIRKNPEKPFKTIAEEFGCSAALVSIIAKEMRDAGK